MSADEDTELRDLVAQSLESKGVLGKIRAQLRASVFLVLDEQDDAENKIPLSNPNLKKFLNNSEGRLVTGLVREFLEFFDLDFTIAVFDPESSFSDRYQGRNNLANELKLNDVDKISSKPLLLEVVQRMLQGGSTINTKQQPPSSNTQTQVKNSSWQNGPISPRSSSPSSIGKEEDDASRSELMISAGFENDDYMKPSKIPQRVKDDRSRSASHSLASENGLDHISEGRLDQKDKSLSDSRHDQPGRGSPDRTIGSDDDDIFSEFMSKQKPSYQANKTKKDNADKKALDKLELGPKSTAVLSSLKGAPSLGGSGLGSLKDAPPLTGTSKPSKDLMKSPDWGDLADIDNRINKLGFDLHGDDKGNHSQEFDYEDDFQPSSEHSLTEEIEEQLSSYHSNSSKADDPLTTDRTVSRASDSGLDYAEDILDDF
ncbi:FGFR1 oncogene partner isoform X2 [Exaiptasia diaphana]|uniref:FGFR1 oncogene partner (FOP) N-terminal dimerisation domain-containing protein n=1 Tax=Exaiptasia diaphana TaxID=2652724 RepID=A0A913XZF0_EXADI|nr:FGFR1 oncogene partner isoform X2 [Exaiptasia diaphana]